jgi:hypothetical protein
VVLRPDDGEADADTLRLADASLVPHIRTMRVAALDWVDRRLGALIVHAEMDEGGGAHDLRGAAAPPPA